MNKHKSKQLFALLLAALLLQGSAALCAHARERETSVYTILAGETDAQGNLLSITEQTRIEKYPGGIHYTEDGEVWQDLAPDTIVSMNLMGFQPSFLEEAKSRFPAFLDRALKENPLKGEYFLPSIVQELLFEGKATMKVLTSPDQWYGVTYAADKPVVVKALSDMAKQGLYPDGLF